MACLLGTPSGSGRYMIPHCNTFDFFAVSPLWEGTSAHVQQVTLSRGSSGGHGFRESQDANVLYLFSKPVAPSYQSIAISNLKPINTGYRAPVPFPKEEQDSSLNQPNHAYPMRRSLKRQ